MRMRRMWILAELRSRPLGGEGNKLSNPPHLLARPESAQQEQHRNEAGPEIVDLLARAGASGRVVAASMQRETIQPLREANLATGASAMDVLSLWLRLMRGPLPQSLPYAALCIPRIYAGLPIPVVGLARLARGASVATHVWTVDEPGVAERLWLAGIQGIVTNDPRTMLSLRARLAQGLAESAR